MSERVRTGGSAACRRRYFKREAKRRLRENGAGLYIASFFALSATAGVRSVCKELPRLLDFSFAGGGEIPALALGFLGDVIIFALIFPLWAGLLRGGGLLAEGRECHASDCFACYGGLREYTASLKLTAIFLLKGALLSGAFALALRAARRLPDSLGEHSAPVRAALIAAALVIAAAGMLELTRGAAAPVIMYKNPVMTAAMASSCSRRAMRGHGGETLRLAASFLPLLAVSVLSGGLLFIVTAPYIAATFAEFCDYIYCLHSYKIENGDYLQKYSYKKRKLRTGDIFIGRV